MYKKQKLTAKKSRKSQINLINPKSRTLDWEVITPREQASSDYISERSILRVQYSPDRNNKGGQFPKFRFLLAISIYHNPPNSRNLKINLKTFWNIFPYCSNSFRHYFHDFPSSKLCFGAVLLHFLLWRYSPLLSSSICRKYFWFEIVWPVFA